MHAEREAQRLADIWSYGCVLAEVLCGEAIFKGSCSTEQFIEIVSILGSPTAAELKQLNPRMAAVDYSVIEPYPLHKVLGPDVSVSGTRLLERLIQYTPSKRLRPEHIITDPFFQALRNPGLKLQDDRDLPERRQPAAVPSAARFPEVLVSTAECCGTQSFRRIALERTVDPNQEEPVEPSVHVCLRAHSLLDRFASSGHHSPSAVEHDAAR